MPEINWVQTYLRKRTVTDQIRFVNPWHIELRLDLAENGWCQLRQELASWRHRRKRQNETNLKNVKFLFTCSSSQKQKSWLWFAHSVTAFLYACQWYHGTKVRHSRSKSCNVRIRVCWPRFSSASCKRNALKHAGWLWKRRSQCLLHDASTRQRRFLHGMMSVVCAGPNPFKKALSSRTCTSQSKACNSPLFSTSGLTAPTKSRSISTECTGDRTTA